MRPGRRYWVAPTADGFACALIPVISGWNPDKGWLCAIKNRKKSRGGPMSLVIAKRLAGSIAAGLLAAAAVMTPAGAQGAKPWRHGIIAPKSDAGFLLMAARGGFAEREGLKLELLEVKDDQIGLKALLAGELESYEGGVQGTIAADVRGADVKILGCHWPLVPHGLMVKAGIGTVQELKGKSIAVSSPGSFPDMFARVALARSNLSASDVQLAAVGGDRDRYTALVGGVVDA